MGSGSGSASASTPGRSKSIAGNVRGVAVHTAARMLSIAGPDEVLISDTTYGLVEGSGLEFEDAGRHALKGLSGDRQVYRASRVIS